MSDGGKGSNRRKEDTEKIRSNWDLIDWGKKSKIPEQPTEKKDALDPPKEE